MVKSKQDYYKNSLGNSAKRLIKYLKRNGDLRKFRPYHVFIGKPAIPSDIVGHLFVDAFENNEESVAAYGYVEVTGELGALPKSIVSDLSLLNDAKHVKNRRRSYIKLLREFSDWCLNEGQFDPKLYPED